MEEPEQFPEAVNNDSSSNDADSVEEMERLAEEAMEQMLLAQDEDEDYREEQHRHGMIDEGETLLHDDPLDNDLDQNGFLNDVDNIGNNEMGLNFNHQHPKENSISYVKASFIAAFALVYYAFRSRQQWYLALVFLSSSKWAYIILGNTLIASLIGIFKLFTGIFMNGLRLAEAEGLGDFFRWNVTETCLALTIFRSELNVKTGIVFLMLVLSKCLHWVADMREGHLRMTEEAVVAQPNSLWPALRWPHIKLLLCLYFLQLIDVLVVLQCGFDIVKNGPSVSILFAFEAGIMLTSVLSNVLLWHLHCFDGVLHFIHEKTDPARSMHRWIHPWKDHKATLVFAVEVQAQAAKFFFYVTFFAIVMTYYGLPINLIREVYLSFQALKQRLVAFKTYRQLMASMNRFHNPTEEELEQEHTCIICRDEMTVETSKRLPGCGHIMHKSCLREWLVQQQTCPTCRSDISAMEARQRQQDAMDAVNQGQELPQSGEEEAEQQDENLDNQETTETTEEKREDRVTSNEDDLRSVGKVSGGQMGNLESLATEDINNTPSAVSVGRSKRVRIATPSHDHDALIKERGVFPAFYRVVKDSGAAVYSDGHAMSFVIRVVPFGVVVLGQEMSWRDCNGESQMMVRIPDGWISDGHLERIVAVPFES